MIATDNILIDAKHAVMSKSCFDSIQECKPGNTPYPLDETTMWRVYVGLKWRLCWVMPAESNPDMIRIESREILLTE